MKCRPLVAVSVSLVFFVLSSPIQAQVSFLEPPSGPSGFVADFNGDGKPDILQPLGGLYLGNGDGTFTVGTPVSGTPLAVADFNGDGKPDILEQGTGTLQVLLGNGDGTFQAPISTPSGANLVPVAAADLNGDGKADVVGVFNGSLLVYLSKGDGTFASGVPYSLGASSLSAQVLSLGDFNGDGKIDAVVSMVGSGPGQEIVLLGNGDGTFQAAKTSAGLGVIDTVVAGDFNGDGKADLAISGFLPCSSNCPPESVFILLGNGDGTFQAPVMALSAGGTLAVADFNGDGKLDLAVEDNNTVGQVFLGNGDGTFPNANSYVLTFPPLDIGATAPSGISVADFNLDGKPDIAWGNTILLGNGDGTFQGIPLSTLPGLPIAMVIGDFDKNGTADVAAVTIPVGTNVATSLNILRNNGKGMLSVIHTYTLPQPAYDVKTADFNGDGNLDLVVSGIDPVSQNWSYSVLLGNGDGSFQSPVLYQQSVTASSQSGALIVVADFNNDHKPDLAVAPVGSQTLAILLGNGDGTFASPVYYFGGVPLVADFNGDGKLDLATSIEGASGTGILYGNGDGTFQPLVFPASLSGFFAELTADLNNDGKPDLVSSNQVALGKGDGTFTLLPPLSSSNFIAGIADFNGDGKLDVFVDITLFYKAFQTGIQLGNGDGTFGPVATVPTNCVPTSCYVPASVFADMNGDGRIDVVFPWGASVSSVQNVVSGVGVLLNSTAANFGLSTSGLSPASVTAGNSASSTVTAVPIFGFNTAVALSCSGLPSGASCGFNPASIANSSGASMLTVTTSASTAAGTYSVQVQGTAGSMVNSVPVSLVVQEPPDFALSQASGSSSSQTVSAGQSAKFTVDVAPSGSFNGTVNFTCGITPTATPAPTCSLSKSSIQISNGASQTVTATVATTAPMTTGAVSHVGFPGGTLPLTWPLMLLAMGWLLVQGRKRLPVLAAPIIVLALLSLVACGGGGSSTSSHTTPGTPAGTYTVTLTATSASLSHSTAMQVTVQ